MLAKVTSCAVVGLDGAIVEVEVDISRELPSFTFSTALRSSVSLVRGCFSEPGVNVIYLETPTLVS